MKDFGSKDATKGATLCVVMEEGIPGANWSLVSADIVINMASATQW
jgi:hypothetical protein